MRRRRANEAKVDRALSHHSLPRLQTYSRAAAATNMLPPKRLCIAVQIRQRANDAWGNSSTGNCGAKFCWRQAALPRHLPGALRAATTFANTSGLQRSRRKRGGVASSLSTGSTLGKGYRSDRTNRSPADPTRQSRPRRPIRGRSLPVLGRAAGAASAGAGAASGTGTMTATRIG